MESEKGLKEEENESESPLNFKYFKTHRGKMNIAQVVKMKPFFVIRTIEMI